MTFFYLNTAQQRSLIFLQLPQTQKVSLFLCSNKTQSEGGVFTPAEAACPLASPPASVPGASGFLLPARPPALARWQNSARQKVWSPERIHGPSQQRGEESKTCSRHGGLAVAGNLQWSTEIWIDIRLNKMQPCAVYSVYACSSFCFALLNSVRILQSAAGFEPYTSGAHVSDQTITYNNWWWTLPILMWSARARRIPERVTKIEERKTLKASHPDLFLLFL